MNKHDNRHVLLCACAPCRPMVRLVHCMCGPVWCVVYFSYEHSELKISKKEY